MKNIKNVLIVDDEGVWLKILSGILNDDYSDFHITTHKDFYKALKFVKKTKDKINLCLVDMKPVLNVEAVIDKRLLKLPEDIFHAIKERNWNDGFYFMSAYKSYHDQEVLERTGANYIDKSGIVERLEVITKNI